MIISTQRQLSLIQDNKDQLHSRIDACVKKWFAKIYARCTSNQKKAAFFIWVRYSTAVRSLHHIRNQKEIADCYTLARCCLELDVSLQAICQDSSLGDTYIEFEKHAKSRYLELLEKTGSNEAIKRATNYMQNKYGSDYKRYRWSSWCAKQGGITGLFKLVNRQGRGTVPPQRNA
ncbi:MAG: hypothetical protein HY762_09020 [Planctomycetes bacterium]|nr:hypothetical protein [Planctomycetota bacterium]